MSILQLSRVWQYSHREGRALLVELALADFADDDGRCWPAIETVASKARCSVRQVQETLRDMTKRGELRVQLSAGPFGVNVYTLMIRGGAAIAPLVQPATGGVQLRAQILSMAAPDPLLDPSKDPLKSTKDRYRDKKDVTKISERIPAPAILRDDQDPTSKATSHATRAKPPATTYDDDLPIAP